MIFPVVNPATGETVREVPGTTIHDTVDAIRLVSDAQRSWRKTGFDLRARLMRNAAAILREQSEELAELMTVEMGKPIGQAVGEAEKCAWVCEYYAENAEAFLESRVVETDASRSLIAFVPLGIVLAVMPWNFPFWQVFRFAAPNLMAGNGALLKHAANVPGCSLAIESVFREAGFPDHLFRSLVINSEEVGAVIESPLVRGVTLTGSTGAGKAVAARAGAHLKKTVLELGGSDPYLVLEDADLRRTVETCATSRLINSGQSCIAAKRFIVVDAVRKEFEERFVERMGRARTGDPMDPETDVGPMARRDLRDDLHVQVTDSVLGGARLLLGGRVPDGPGAYYPPTVLTDVAPGTPAYDDELFGPVAAVIPVRDEEEAIRVANDSPFGLGAAVFTEDRERGERIATHELEAGACFVNAFVRSDPRLPFGGVKESGYGRELSPFGIQEFVNIKTVWVD